MNDETRMNGYQMNEYSGAPVTPPPMPAPAMEQRAEGLAQSTEGVELRAQSVEQRVESAEPSIKTKTSKLPRLSILLTGGLFLLVVVMISAVFFFLSQGNSQLMDSLGIENVGASGLILLSVGIITTVLALISFVSVLIGVFKYMNANRDDKKSKKKGLIWVGAAFLAFLFFVIASFFSFTSVKGGPAKISELIQTDPEITTGLSAPVTIVFDAANLPIDESKFKIIGYNWDFGDGERATGPTISHTFVKKPASGIYTVQLKVSYQDANDTSADIKEEVFERVVSISNEKVAASFSFDPPSGPAPLIVSFDASASKDPDGEIVNYEWDFNDDGIYEDEGVNTKHTFTEAGSFNVTLRLTDSNGEYSTVSNLVAVKGDSVITAVVKNLPEDEILTPDRAYQFDASESKSAEGEILAYEWNFGDGAASKGRKVTHAFTKEGIYEVSLKMTDAKGNSKVFLKNYTVSSSPSGLFAKIQSTPAAVSGSIKGTAPFKVAFDAGASSGGDIVDYSWDFNDDGVFDAKGQIVDHVFTNSGAFTTKLLITSSDNKTAIATVKVDVAGTGLQARVSANPVNGIVPLVVNFDASATIVPAGENVVTFQWDFGDGTPILREGPIVSHRYTQIGVFTAKVNAITSQNKTAETSTTVFVNSTPLKACYTMSRTVGPAPLTVSFNPQCSTGTISQYTWKFGELGVSNDRKATFTFNGAGEYDVTLEIADPDNNVSTFKDKVVVQ